MEFTDEKKMRAIINDLIENAPKKPWVAEMKALKDHHKGAMADENDMKVLQESFDSVTRVTTQIKRVACELMRVGKTTACSDLAQKGISKCNAIHIPQGIVEKMLMTPMSQLTSNAVKDALHKCACPYKDLIAYYNELIALYKHHDHTIGH